jgi:hypothetical protein
MPAARPQHAHGMHLLLRATIEQGTSLRLPAPSLAAELFHFEWVMCDTCDKWRHLRLRCEPLH